MFTITCWFQDAKKLMEHSKRRILSTADIDQALKLHNVEVHFIWMNETFIIIRPRGTIVPSGLMFYCWCLCYFAVLYLWAALANHRETFTHDGSVVT